MYMCINNTYMHVQAHTTHTHLWLWKAKMQRSEMRARFWSLCCLCCCAHIRQLEKSLCNDEHSPSHSLFHTHTGRASRLHSKNGENEQFFTATLDLICMCLSVCVFIKLMKIARHYFKLLTYIRVCVFSVAQQSSAMQCRKAFTWNSWKINMKVRRTHSHTHTHARTISHGKCWNYWFYMQKRTANERDRNNQLHTH